MLRTLSGSTAVLCDQTILIKKTYVTKQIDKYRLQPLASCWLLGHYCKRTSEALLFYNIFSNWTCTRDLL